MNPRDRNLTRPYAARVRLDSSLQSDDQQRPNACPNCRIQPFAVAMFIGGYGRGGRATATATRRRRQQVRYLGHGIWTHVRRRRDTNRTRGPRSHPMPFSRFLFPRRAHALNARGPLFRRRAATRRHARKILTSISSAFSNAPRVGPSTPTVDKVRPRQ